MDESTHLPQDLISRRSLMVKGAAVGAGATAVGRLLADPPDAFAKKGRTRLEGGRLAKGDAAILGFLAAAEIIESDLWEQYNELAGIQDGEVPGGSGNDAYTEAVEVLDEDMNQSTTTPTTSSAMSRSSTPTCRRTARKRSTSTSSGRFRAARRTVLRRTWAA
jgi:hypothetical protein